MHTDPISDMLTRIRNAQMVDKSEVILPYSKVKFRILEILSKEGWIGKVEKMTPVEYKSETDKPKKLLKKDKAGRFDNIRVELKYGEEGESKITVLKRVSKPGRRVYAKRDNIPVVLNGLGILVISTSKGLMTDNQAREEKVGGEIICEIY